ncbi:MAG TPA: preprotein translocase subunit SecA [Nocardioidaceae bacterium]|nr:preprotein translocase subunit SecA [Nocardioidaceae bacterium]
MGVLDRVLRMGEGRKVKALQSLVPDINALEAEIHALSDDALKHKTVEFRERLANGADLDDLLLEAFAVTREAASRVIGQRHFDVQLMGGAALHFGWVAEMKTGEGKTLVSTLPGYLNGLTGKGMHLVTVNDYLAKFQSEWMGRIYRWMGLKVGLIVPDMHTSSAEKREQYAADITYGINNEFGFDYLRDNMAMSKENKVQRGHAYAIVDEVDSILIDEARTPLIISGRMQDAASLYYKFATVVRGLQRDVDYDVEEDKRHVAILEAGIEKVEQALGVENLYDEVQQNLVHQLSVALKAKELYKRDKDYVVMDGEVKIVDEFTGRILDGRRWSEGLHQAVEAKEGVKIKEENQTLATITLQNYFRLYDKLAGMTGTAVTEAAELASTYDLTVVPIPTNKPVVRKDEGDLIYKTEDAKFNAVIDDLKERYERGQPVLVGTVSVEKSYHLSGLLKKEGIPHEVLNAKEHTREGEIVAQAGRLHAITVATNMAGRGVDILLGGNPEGLARREVKAEGLDPESDEGRPRFLQLVEKYEPETKAEGDRVRELGGLYVLGTERHESRRIDNQLRGRAGRQGDPGESRFYLSLEDELMRLFATGAMSWVMGKALPDDVPIEAKMVSKAIERAQGTVEARNAEIRKNVLKYDEVLNAQRKVIYRRRDQILEGEDLREEALDAVTSAVERVVRAQELYDDEGEDVDYEALVTELREYYPTALTPEQMREMEFDDIVEAAVTEVERAYEAREAELGAETMRSVERQVMLRVLDTRWREHLYEMDYLQEGIHLRAMGQKDPLTEWQREGFEMFNAMMSAIDDDFAKYVLHLQVVKQEPAALPDVSNFKYTAPSENPQDAAHGVPSVAQVPVAQPQPDVQIADGPRAPQQPDPTATMAPIVRSAEEKIGRNDPCHCGSGKKYKHCHGR